MSVSFTAIGWNRQKKIYDLTLFALLTGILGGFCLSAYLSHPEITAETLMIRGSAFAAIALLHVALAIGPLTRIDSRFLPLLYNRRHLGVMIFIIALFHASLSVFQFHALGNLPAGVSAISSYWTDIAFWKKDGLLSQIPFEPFGLVALLILFLMAATSHDFWLKHWGALAWKKIHLLIYLAYGSLIVHFSFGLLQSERHPALALMLAFGMVTVATLHGVAFLKNRQRHRVVRELQSDGFYLACQRSQLIEGRAITVEFDDQRVALYLHQGQVRAVSNICRHQGGPIGEGRIVDGCITCPWHGWQYRPEDGCSPPPFREVLATFATRVHEGQVYVHPLQRRAELPRIEVAP